MRSTFAVMFSIASLVHGSGRVDADGPTCQDTNVIRWYTPGKFEEARKAAESQTRLMMIKGIAFGIDELGAVNAIKGCW